jgi:hypothetical protein
MLEKEVAVSIAEGIINPSNFELYEDEVITLKKMCKTLPAKNSKAKLPKRNKTEFSFLFKGKVSSQHSEDTEVPQSPIASNKVIQRDTSENRNNITEVYSKYFSRDESLGGKRRMMEELKDKGKEVEDKIINIAETLNEEDKRQISRVLDSMRKCVKEIKEHSHIPLQKPSVINKTKAKNNKPNKRRQSELDDFFIQDTSLNEDERTEDGSARIIYKGSSKIVKQNN